MLNLVQSCLSKRRKRTKINQSWIEILSGVLEGSILGPILFNNFLSDLFLFVKDVNFANYSDNNTIYQSGRNVDDVINDGQMKANTDKSHLIMSTNNTPELKVRDSLIKTSTCEKLGVKNDYKLTFDNYVANLCKKALRTLARATPSF